MYQQPKEIISFRVRPELKEKLISHSEENGFDSLSQYLEQVASNSIEEFSISKLTKKDLHLIKRIFQSEFQKDLNQSIDHGLEKILDELNNKLVPKASSTTFNKYSTENFTREDLKTTLFDFINKCITDENLSLIRLIRKELD